MSKSTNTLETGADDPFFDFADRASRIMQPVGEIPWIVPALTMFAPKSMQDILDFRKQEATERFRQKGLHDLFVRGNLQSRERRLTVTTHVELSHTGQRRTLSWPDIWRVGFRW
jgi:hypothetical protein